MNGWLGWRDELTGIVLAAFRKGFRFLEFIVFYEKEQAGRMFDFTEGGPKKYNFDFGQLTGGEISTDKLTGIDATLSAIFQKRVAELGSPVRKVAKVS